MLHSKSTREGFTLVEIMIVVAIIALLAAIAVPNFMRSRKRAQATMLLDELRILDNAIEQYAIEKGKKVGDAFSFADLKPYVKPGSRLYNSNGNDIHGHEMTTFGGGVITDTPGAQIRVCILSYQALSDVAPREFWSPYGIEGY